MFTVFGNLAFTMCRALQRGFGTRVGAIVTAALRNGPVAAASLPAETRAVRFRTKSLRGLAVALAAVAATLVGGIRGTQDAVANGDTRTLSIYHTHSRESLTVTFKRDGRYDRAALEQLNWLLRDWRNDEPTKMDPRLFDTVWEAYRQVGSSEPINIVSAYRSPGTNAMLRRRSKAVAEFSQHMLGKAMDFYLPDVSIDRIRAVGMRLQRGGVGWYPRSGSPFVHLDVGSVRSWPRMTHDQLAHLFPDGKTVHLPTDNRPLARYEEARAEILSRGGTVLGYTQYAQAADEDDGPSIKGFFAGLFGGGSETPAQAPAARTKAKQPAIAVASADPEDGVGTQQALAYAAPEAIKPDPKTVPDAKALLTAAAPDRPGALAAAKLEAFTAPLPPRRPSEFAAVAAALAMPLPPPRPSQLAALGSAAGMANLAVEPTVSRPARKAVLVPAEADSRTQLRALFESVAAVEAGRPAVAGAPVKLAAARVRADAAPDALVSAAVAPVSSRFAMRSPEDDLSTSRFSGSATRPVPGSR